MHVITEKQPLYLQIASDLEFQIKNHVLKPGDKLISVRAMSREKDVSISTILMAYSHLESSDLIEGRPQSGYYVCDPAKPVLMDLSTRHDLAETENLITHFIENACGSGLTFSPHFSSNESLSLKLNHIFRRINRDTVQEENNIRGSLTLRKAIVKRSLNWIGRQKADDLITAPGCMPALAWTLMTLTRPGDTIAMESPIFFGVLRLAKSIGLKVLELPTHPKSGVDINSLEKAMQNPEVKACILVSNFNNPLGSSMPDEHKIEAVRLAELYNLPLIEDDLYGDIYFGSKRPVCCKKFDTSGIVIWCGSFHRAMTPGHRVGWLSAGRFAEDILKTKTYHSNSWNTINETAIGHFLENGHYEKNLKELRSALKKSADLHIRAIREYFPKNTLTSEPQGGFNLWIELDQSIDTSDLYQIALKHNISITPGRMYSLQNHYNNCFRLSFGSEWDQRSENGIRLLGKLAQLR